MYVKQKPNKAIFLNSWRIYLTSYNFLHRKKDDTPEFQNKKHGFFGRFRLKSIEALGEAPVIFDSTKIPYSILQMQTFLRNKGYYNSKIQSQIKYKGKKKAKVLYTVDLGKPYTVNNITLKTPLPYMNKLLIEDSLNLPLKKESLFDINLLNTERLYISNLFQNRGYYDFNEYYVNYKADTTVGNHKVNVVIEIDNPLLKKEGSDSLYTGKHSRYRIRNIYVQPDFNAANPNLSTTDTLTVLGDISRSKRTWKLDTTMINYIYRDTL